MEAATPAPTTEIKSRVSAQARNWVRPAAPTPRSLPASRWCGRTAETMTSTTRLVFSSMTLVSTAWPHMSTVV